MELNILMFEHCSIIFSMVGQKMSNGNVYGFIFNLLS